MATEQQNLAERGMAVGLRALNRLAASGLVDRFGLRQPTERFLHGASKTTMKTAARAGRTFAAAQQLTKPARQPRAKRSDLFDLTPDDEQQMLQESVRDFAAAKVRPAAQAADAACAAPVELLAQSNELGLTMVGVPEELGGAVQERSAVTSVLMSEALAHGDMGFAVAALAPAALRRGRSHVLEHDGVTIFADVFAPPPRLFVYGAVDVAEALCRAAKLVGWTSVVADARARFATRERLPSADEILVAWPEEAFAQVQPDIGTAVVVLTHDDKFDVPALAAALESEAFYIGALGSRRNQERRRERLLEAGVPEAALARIAGPCGLDIGATSSAETALSMLAEMLATRSGRSGGPLRDAASRIHAEPVAGKK